MDAFDILRQEALDSLSFEAFREAHFSLSTLRLFLGVRSSFSNDVSYGIFETLKDRDILLLRAEWRRDLDRPRSPLEAISLAILPREPTIEVKSVEREKAWAASVISRFEGLSAILPIQGETRVGADGTFYHLACGDHWGNAMLQWWEDGPAAWQPITSKARALIREFEDPHLEYREGIIFRSYAVDLVWDPPGVQSAHLAGIRELIPGLSEIPITQLLEGLRGSTRVHTGVFNRNTAAVKCIRARELGIAANMYHVNGSHS
ncbi:MAG: hypothetical protein ACTHN5_17180 [Phycisphaerae bacterium]